MGANHYGSVVGVSDAITALLGIAVAIVAIVATIVVIAVTGC